MEIPENLKTKFIENFKEALCRYTNALDLMGASKNQVVKGAKTTAEELLERSEIELNGYKITFDND